MPDTPRLAYARRARCYARCQMMPTVIIRFYIYGASMRYEALYVYPPHPQTDASRFFFFFMFFRCATDMQRRAVRDDASVIKSTRHADDICFFLQVVIFYAFASVARLEIAKELCCLSLRVIAPSRSRSPRGHR